MLGRGQGIAGFLAALACLAALAGGLAAAPAQAAPYAAIVMDMRTGEVVHEVNADNRQHPASLTKMMTLYLAFEAVRSGQLRLDQRVRVSAQAARMPASKLYLRAGQRVSVRHLIRAAAIKSANDAAMVLAEAIGGSQRGFARLMTEKARALGMANTSFRNPHGLTQPGHMSTARDMAILARRLYFDFPEYYNVFGRISDQAAGKRINTTNRLLRTYDGAEGMKTGYTRAAGYNLVATAARGDQRVIAVVMGGRSSAWRTQRTADLLDLGFDRTPRVAQEIRPGSRRTRVAEAPIPPARPDAPVSSIEAAVASVLASPAAAALPDPATRNAPLYAELPPVRPARAGAPGQGTPVRVARAGRPAGPMPPDRPGPDAGWAVQVGAYLDRRDAVRRLNSIPLDKLPMLANAAPHIAADRSRSGRTFYKARFHGLEREEARAACARLRKSGRDCLAMAPR